MSSSPKQGVHDSLARGDQPVLLTGQTDGTTGSHYRVVTGAGQNGDLLMADPAIDFRDEQNDDFKISNFSFAPPMSMAELLARPERTEHITHPGADELCRPAIKPVQAPSRYLA